MIFKLVQTNYSPLQKKFEANVEIVIDNITEYQLAKWVKVETHEHYKNIFESQNPRIPCYFNQPSQIFENGTPSELFKPFVVNGLSYKRKGEDYHDHIYFDCEAFLMNDEGKTIERLTPTNPAAYCIG